MPRFFAIGAMLCLVACAAIAGLEAPAELEQSSKPPDRTTPDPTSTSPTPQQPQNGDASSTAQDGATSTDAGTKDADSGTVTPPPCAKTPNGGGCTDGITCCSGKCNEAKTCANDCRSLASSCDPFASAPCCVGLYCNTALCAPCIGQGGTAADSAIGGKNAKSCCSRMVGADGKCL